MLTYPWQQVRLERLSRQSTDTEALVDRGERSTNSWGYDDRVVCHGGSRQASMVLKPVFRSDQDRLSEGPVVLQDPVLCALRTGFSSYSNERGKNGRKAHLGLGCTAPCSIMR